MKSQVERRDAMIEAVESPSGFEALRTIVRGFAAEGIDLQILMEDLDQIRALVSEPDEDSVLDVMDLVVGDCTPSMRIGPYSWGDPRNPLRERWS